MSRARAQSSRAVRPSEPEADRRTEILRAAVEVFASKGYHGARIADVAKEAGVAYGLVYHYFRNKEELLESVYAESFGRWAEAVIRLAEQAEDGLVSAKLERMLEYAMQAYLKDPQGLRVLILEIVRSPAFREASKVSAMQQVLESTARLIAKGQKSGEFRDDVHPFLAATTLFGGLETMLTTFVMGASVAQTPEGVEKAKRDLLSIYLAGMAPAAKGFKPPAAPARG